MNVSLPLGGTEIEKTVEISGKTGYHRKKDLITYGKFTKSMILKPTNHECIETIAKKQYWSLVKEYSKSSGIDEAFERDIELLKKFLEEADMHMLRQQTEECLSKNESPQVVIELDKEGNLNVRVQ